MSNTEITFQGYDTALNSDLPEEVKEKIAIARILITNPDILILDDCMNHISSLTQMAIIYEFVSVHETSQDVQRDPHS